MQHWAGEFATRNPKYQEWVQGGPAPEGAKVYQLLPGLVYLHVFHDGGETVRFSLMRTPRGLCVFPGIREFGFYKEPLPQSTHARYVDVRFNLETSIAVQLKEVETRLDRYKKLMKQQGLIKPIDTKPNDEKFPLYLRCSASVGIGQLPSFYKLHTMATKRRNDPWKKSAEDIPLRKRRP
ncbi:MAG: hypothetical protein HQL87_12760, partial [Magnetococcales bacterium]|nr:hypothetical protein [Magnetococcales bacterium]